MKIYIMILFLLSTINAQSSEKIVFSAGCFWGVEKYYDAIDGVLSARSGYVGGNYLNPNYKKVLNYRDIEKNSEIINYTEGVEVIYDETRVSAEVLIKSFWELHDPTQVNGQGNDIGNNYRSALFYTTDKQKKIA